MEFKKPQRRQQRPLGPVPTTTQQPPTRPIAPPALSILNTESSQHPAENQTKEKKSPKKKKSWILWILLAIVVLLALCAGGSYLYYKEGLKAVSSDATPIKITIEAGKTPDEITNNLQKSGVLRDKLVFSIFLKISGDRNKLQAGTHYVAKNMTAQQILEKLKKAEVEKLSATFLPGATIMENKAVFKKLGFSDDEIEKGFSSTFTGELFADKPAGTSLEGYIYGDTYEISPTQTVAQILQRTFDLYEKKLNEKDLIAKFKQKNLTLYQAITLASIVQREVSAKNSSSASSDQKQVAQVFFSRIANGMNLGSDVTFLYGAELQGIKNPLPTLDSPYNTRIHTGLPPGPIATPSLGALEAVAEPAAGDYLYFVAGDNGTTYFAKTNEEHEANVKAQCTTLCQ